MTLLLCAVIALSHFVHAQEPANAKLSLRNQTFEKAWQVVNDGFYDRKMKGVDWKGAHDRYAPKVNRTLPCFPLGCIPKRIQRERPRPTANR
jgi:hypothetical protein